MFERSLGEMCSGPDEPEPGSMKTESRLKRNTKEEEDRERRMREQGGGGQGEKNERARRGKRE